MTKFKQFENAPTYLLQRNTLTYPLQWYLGFRSNDPAYRKKIVHFVLIIDAFTFPL